MAGTYKKIISLFSLIVTSVVALAQETKVEETSSEIAKIISDPINYIMLFTIVVLLSTILVMARVIRLLTWQLAGPPQEPVRHKVEKSVEKRDSFWERLNNKLSDAVPLEKEADVLLDHDYDGIKELDNNLPPWWKYGFYITIVVAFIYMIHYHVVGSGNVQIDEYNQQLAEAEMEKKERLKMSAAEVDETTATYMEAEADLAAGKKIYDEKCLVCHGQKGEGLVGPNLTDDFWINGGSIKNIFNIIKYGVPAKGMLAWQGQLSPVQIQQVSSFVKSIHGTNPPNPKEPQGDLYKEVVEVIASDSTSADSIVVQ